jgi:hypothetical protein
VTPLPAPALAWHAAGSPAPTWPVEPVPVAACACCGTPAMTSIPIARFVSETYSQPADFLPFGERVCPACAWWHSETKQRHRSWLTDGARLWWPILSAETAAAEPDAALRVAGQRPAWRDLLRHVATLPAATPLAGLLTTDPKPRLWPRVRAGTVGRALLYVHSTGDKSPVGDVSAGVACDLREVARLLGVIEPPLAAGWTKRALGRGLLTDHARATRNLAGTLALERVLAGERGTPAWSVALLVAGKDAAGG